MGTAENWVVSSPSPIPASISFFCSRDDVELATLTDMGDPSYGSFYLGREMPPYSLAANHQFNGHMTQTKTIRLSTPDP